MSAEPALQLVESMEVDQKALSFAESVALMPVIKTQGEYLCAGQAWKTGRDLLKEIDDGYDDLIKAAHKLHKDAVAKKARYYTPVDAAVRTVKQLMSAYDAQQEALRQAEQRRLEEIARKEAEEEALLAAIAAEEEAKRNGATKEEAAQEAQAVIEQPVYVAPVVIPKTVPKMQGGPVYRTIWKHQVDDLVMLVKSVASGRTPIQALQANDVFLGQQARSLGASMNIPGVRSYSERV